MILSQYKESTTILALNVYFPIRKRVQWQHFSTEKTYTCKWYCRLLWSDWWFYFKVALWWKFVQAFSILFAWALLLVSFFITQFYHRVSFEKPPSFWIGLYLNPKRTSPLFLGWAKATHTHKGLVFHRAFFVVHSFYFSN